MNRRRRVISLWVLFVLGIWCRPTTAQLLPEEAVIPFDRSAFLAPPSRRDIERGLQPLSSKLPDISPREGRRPVDVSQGVFEGEGRAVAHTAYRGDEWVPIHYQWVAPDLRYRPLYFEDAMLERHGQTRHPLVQPLASGTRYILTFPVLPYAMVVDPPCRARSALGHYRAGSAAPLLLQRPPFQANAGLAEAGIWVGLIFLIP